MVVVVVAVAVLLLLLTLCLVDAVSVDAAVDAMLMQSFLCMLTGRGGMFDGVAFSA